MMYREFNDFARYMADREQPDFGTAEFFAYYDQDTAAAGEPVMVAEAAQPDALKLQMSPSLGGATGGMTPARTEYEQKEADKQQKLLERPTLDFQNLYNEVNRIGNEFGDLIKPFLPEQPVDIQLSPETGFGADAGTFTGKVAHVAGLGDTRLSPEAFQPIRKTDAPERFESGLVDAWQKLKHGTVGAPLQLAELGLLLTAIAPTDAIVKNISEEDARDMQIGLIEAADRFKKIRVGALGADPYEEAQGFVGFLREIITDPTIVVGAGLNAARKAIGAGVKKTIGKTAEPSAIVEQVTKAVSPIGQPDPMAITTRGEAVRNLIEGYQPSGRLNVNSQLKGIISASDSGELDDARFKQAVSDLQTEIANRQVHKAAQYVEPATGHNSLVAKVRDEVKKGRITREAADMIEWASLKNPNLARNLTASSNKKLLPGQASGIYLSGEQKIVFRGAQDVLELMRVGEKEARTPVHEFLHHTERLLPQDIRDAVSRLWWKHSSDALLKAVKSGDNDLVEYLRLSMSGDTKKAAEKFISMQRKDIGTLYQYANASEFWAENGSKIIQSRSVGGLGDKAASYYRELAEKMKDTIGASSDNALYKAIRDLKTAPADVSGKFMSEGKITAPTGVTKGEKVAAGAAVSGAAIAGKAGYDARERRMQERAGDK